MGCGGGGTQRVLWVGNSQIEVFRLDLIVQSISESAPASCPRIVSTEVAVGGTTLRDLWRMGDAERAIRSGMYDTVIIAEAIDLVFPIDEDYPAAFDTYARLFINAAREAGARPILYATPQLSEPGRDRAADFRAQAAPQLALGRELGVQVATGGLAWLRVWTEFPELDLYAPDGQHPGYIGSTLSGYVLYATITGATPVGTTTMPTTECTDGPCTPITPAQGAAFQRHAWNEYLTNGR